MRRARASIGLGLLALLATSVSCASLTTWATTPSGAFADHDPPPPPDYADPNSWAALPGVASAAEEVPPGIGAVAVGSAADVDVFFLHPTTYFGRGGWNGSIDGFLSRRIIAHPVLAGQASAFNSAGRIYAPRYRQMTLSGFGDPEIRERGLDVAYRDVRRAFEYYLDHYHDGRPILLAGHSQGSRHLLRLLDDFFATGPLRELLVAAYAVGAPVWMGPYERGEARIPICEDAEQTGCVVSWRTFAEGADASLDSNPDEPADGPSLCVNPLTWRSDEAPAPPSDNLGSIPIPYFGGPASSQPALVGARCQDGFLWIDRPPGGFRYAIAHHDGNYHAYDYGLFYMNVRENARRRVAAYLRRADRAASENPAPDDRLGERAALEPDRDARD